MKTTHLVQQVLRNDDHHHLSTTLDSRCDDHSPPSRPLPTEPIATPFLSWHLSPPGSTACTQSQHFPPMIPASHWFPLSTVSLQITTAKPNNATIPHASFPSSSCSSKESPPPSHTPCTSLSSESPLALRNDSPRGCKSGTDTIFPVPGISSSVRLLSRCARCRGRWCRGLGVDVG